MRPTCAYCHNKVNDNVYIWVESEQKLVHKVCRIVNNEIRKDVVVTLNPVHLGTKLEGGA